MDPAVIGSNLGGPVAIAIFITLIKAFYEKRIPVTNSLHDSGLRVLAVLLGIVGYSIDFLGKHGYSFVGLENAAGTGLAAGLGAVVTYHLVAGSLFGSNNDNSDSTPTATLHPAYSATISEVPVAAKTVVTELPVA